MKKFSLIIEKTRQELKEAELLTERLNLVVAAEPYVGKYYSQDYVRRKILRQYCHGRNRSFVAHLHRYYRRSSVPDPNHEYEPCASSRSTPCNTQKAQ